MKYPNRIFINIIIQNLNKIRAPIKTDKRANVVGDVCRSSRVLPKQRHT